MLILFKTVIGAVVKVLLGLSQVSEKDSNLRYAIF